VLDRAAIALLRPLLDGMATGLRRVHVGADALTWTGFVLGLGAATAIAFGAYPTGLLMMLASRLCDGLDGAVARQTQPTDRGAFLDIALDFVFYASIPLAFAIADPPGRALAAATLLAAFVGTGASFLAYAVLAERRGMASTAYPRKGFYYLGGLTEASETLICFVLMCLLPGWFAGFAYIFAALCALTLTTRIVAGWRAFG